MNDRQDQALSDQIRPLYETLSPAERKLSDVLIAHQHDILSYSATELAALAGVSKASTARFFRRLGYDDFSAFRQRMRDQESASSPLHQLARQDVTTRRRPRPDQAWTQHLQRDVIRLQALQESCATTDIAAFADLLATAPRIWVLGFRNSQMLAIHAQSLLSQLRPDVRQLVDVHGHEAEQLADVARGDLLLVMDFRRRTRSLSALVEATGLPPARVLLLTDSRFSRLSVRAKGVLCCPASGEPLFDSDTAAVSLINFLVSEVATRLRQPARNRLARIERLHVALDDLDDE